MLNTFSQLASRFNDSQHLATVFSLRAVDRAKGCSLIRTEAGRADLPRRLGTLLRHECKLTILVLLRLVIIFAARDHHVSRRSQLTLKGIRTRRHRCIEISIARAFEAQFECREVEHCAILAKSSEAQQATVGVVTVPRETALPFA